MARARKACSNPTCPELQPCPTHKPKPWATSTRRQRLPRGWGRIRARILRRDPICKVCGNAASVEVDHIVAGDDHSDANLQGICKRCHREKTQAEAGRARRLPGANRPPFIVICGDPGVGKTAVRKNLAAALNIDGMGPDDLGSWDNVYARLDQADGAIVECVRLPRTLRRKVLERQAVVIQLTATETTRRQRLKQRGESDTTVQAFLADDGAGIGYHHHVTVAFTLSTDNRDAEQIADDLARRIHGHLGGR